MQSNFDSQNGSPPGETYKHLMKSADEIREHQRAMCQVGYSVEEGRNLNDFSSHYFQCYSSLLLRALRSSWMTKPRSCSKHTQNSTISSVKRPAGMGTKTPAPEVQRVPEEAEPLLCSNWLLLALIQNGRPASPRKMDQLLVVVRPGHSVYSLFTSPSGSKELMFSIQI